MTSTYLGSRAADLVEYKDKPPHHLSLGDAGEESFTCTAGLRTADVDDWDS